MITSIPKLHGSHSQLCGLGMGNRPVDEIYRHRPVDRPFIKKIRLKNQAKNLKIIEFCVIFAKNDDIIFQLFYF